MTPIGFILLFVSYFVSIQINVVCCTCLFYEIYLHYITNTHIVSPVLHVEAIYIWHMFKSYWDVSIYFDFVYTSSAYIIIVICTCLPPVPLHNFSKDDLSSRTRVDCIVIHTNDKNKSLLGYPVEINPSVRSIFVFAHASHGSDGSICVPRCAGKLFETLRCLIFVIRCGMVYIKVGLLWVPITPASFCSFGLNPAIINKHTRLDEERWILYKVVKRLPLTFASSYTETFCRRTRVRRHIIRPRESVAIDVHNNLRITYIYIDYNNKVIPIVGRDVSRSPRRGVPIVSVEDATRPAPRLTALSPPPPNHRPIRPIDNRPTYLTLCFFGFAVYQIYNRVGQFVRARSERVWRWSDVWRSERTTRGKKPDVAVGRENET